MSDGVCSPNAGRDWRIIERCHSCVFDSTGNYVWHNTNGHATHSACDPFNRLTSSDYSTDESFAYQYDAVGNRTVMTDTTDVHTYTYDAANRLTSAGGVPYTWDARGNLTNDGVFTYTYNAAGRLARAESVTATIVYTYTAAGLRVAQSVDGDVTTFAWDLATPLAQVLATSDDVLNLYGLTRIGEVQGGEWNYLLPDAMGSVRQWTDSGGEVTYAAGYTPFGEKLWHTGSATSAWGYTGEWQDPSVGMVYLRARWYQPQTGRFAQPDPFPGLSTWPQTQDRYPYTANNPVLHTDPSGETFICFVWPVGTLVCIIGGVAIIMSSGCTADLPQNPIPTTHDVTIITTMGPIIAPIEEPVVFKSNK